MISRMLALVVALVAVLLLAVAGPGTRAGLWQFTTGLQMLRYQRVVSGGSSSGTSAQGRRMASAAPVVPDATGIAWTSTGGSRRGHPNGSCR